MNLRDKLSLISGNEGFEDDLAGVSSTPHINSQNASNEDSESTIDFNLGVLSIDEYLKETGADSRKSSKYTRKSKKTRTREFDLFFDDFTEDEIGRAHV